MKFFTLIIFSFIFLFNAFLPAVFAQDQDGDEGEAAAPAIEEPETPQAPPEDDAIEPPSEPQKPKEKPAQQPKKQAPKKAAAKKKAPAKKNAKKKRLLPDAPNNYYFSLPTQTNNEYRFTRPYAEAARIAPQEEQKKPAQTDKKSAPKKKAINQQQQIIRDKYVVDLSKDVKPFNYYLFDEHDSIYRDEELMHK